jgi:dihydrofolate reductase
VSVTIIVARAENNVIGNSGQIPWHVPADFAHFKATTLGHPIVMGRKTYESIGRPLPGRTTVVVTRGTIDHPDVLVSKSVEKAINVAKSLDDEVFVCGGERVYEGVLYEGLADRMLVSVIPGEPDGDRHFEFDKDEWIQTAFSQRDGFRLVTYEPTQRALMMRAIASAQANHVERLEDDWLFEGYVGDIADALIKAGFSQ